MKKRTVSLLLAILLASLSFASCSQSTENAGDDDAQMIDIIHDNIGDSFPLAWSNELSQVLMQATFYNAVIGDGDFASKYKSLEKVSNKQLEKIVKSFRERTEG